MLTLVLTSIPRTWGQTAPAAVHTHAPNKSMTKSSLALATPSASRSLGLDGAFDRHTRTCSVGDVPRQSPAEDDDPHTSFPRILASRFSIKCRFQRF